MLRKCQILIFNQPPQQVSGNENPFEIQACTFKSFFSPFIYTLRMLLLTNSLSNHLAISFDETMNFDSFCHSQVEISVSIFRRPFERTLFLVPCSHNSIHRRVVWFTIRAVALLCVETRLFLAGTIVLVTSTPPNSVPFFIQRQIQQCCLVVQSLRL
jgi:hypothetical protein